MSISSPPAGTGQNPADIAREAFRRLATRRIAPTPDAYRAIYDEIAGVPPAPPAQLANPAAEVLESFARRLSETPGEVSEPGRRMLRAARTADWTGYAQALSQMADRHLRRNTPVMALGDEDPDARQLREMLGRSLAYALATLLAGSPVLVQEAEALGAAAKLARGEELGDLDDGHVGGHAFRQEAEVAVAQVADHGFAQCHHFHGEAAVPAGEQLVEDQIGPLVHPPCLTLGQALHQLQLECHPLLSESLQRFQHVAGALDAPVAGRMHQQRRRVDRTSVVLNRAPRVQIDVGVGKKLCPFRQHVQKIGIERVDQVGMSVKARDAIALGVIDGG